VITSSRASNSISQEPSPKKSEEKSEKKSYSCESCRDTGWILVPQEYSAPAAVDCKCREVQKVKDQWISYGLNPEKSKQTFNNFTEWNDTAKKSKNAAMSYYRNFQSIRESRKNSILFCGQVGSGKTHLSVALALNFIKKNIKVVYMPYRDVITGIKQNMLDYEYYKRLLWKYQSCEVLLMDDLFKGKINESDINIVFEILNYRYLNYLPIIVSSELTVEGLLSFDEAIGSRIYEMCKDYLVEIDKSVENNYRLR
jgi:DNA replication protein DnaC